MGELIEGAMQQAAQWGRQFMVCRSIVASRSVAIAPSDGRRTLADIELESNPSRERLDRLGVFDWPIWEKEISTFHWTYDAAETCYLLEGTWW